MAGQVKVEDFEVFNLFRVAMLKFAQAADLSLSSADSEIARTHSWLEGEQRSYWQGQLRKRSEAVKNARDALRQKKLYKDSTGRMPDAAQEEKTLARCLAAVEQADDKIEAVRKWLPKLEKAADLYRGGVSPLNRAVTSDIPRAVALLDRLAATLEQYVQIETPAVDRPESAAPSALEESIESISRGGDAIPDPPPRADDTSATVAGQSAGAPASESETPTPREVRDVAAGQ